MTELRSVLDEAEREGLISGEANERLLPFLTERGVTVGARAAKPVEDAAWSDTETPRFIRGFHDVLITIGVIVALSGLWGLASVLVVLPAIVVLSEILVKRQRLALPAVALTIALVCATTTLTAFWVSSYANFLENGNDAIRFIAPFPVLLGLYYLRYGVPLSLALCIVSGLALVLAVVIKLILSASGDPLLLVNNPSILSWIGIVSAAGLFATALKFDLSDINRRTTRSDIAFWLHMAAAPALLYSIVSLFVLRGGLIELTQTVSFKTPVVVLTVAALMLVGLVIDRRAFVTSGLLSLGFALFGIFRQGSATIDTYFSTTLLVVGAIVLVIGTGWMPLRRRVVNALPSALARRLPPA